MHAIATLEALSRVYVQFAWQLECVWNMGDAYTGNTANTTNTNTQKQSKHSKQSKHCKCTATTANKQVHHQTWKQCNSAQNANLHPFIAL